MTGYVRLFLCGIIFRPVRCIRTAFRGILYNKEKLDNKEKLGDRMTGEGRAMYECLWVLIGLWIGGAVGVFTMCLLQINRCERCPGKR